MITRDVIINTARSWTGTPYHHQARRKLVGTDCLGLVLGVYRELYGDMPEVIPGYSPDWAEASGTETMLEGARRHLTETDRNSMLPGDVLIFRMNRNSVAKHAGILAYDNKMIHAMEGMSVSEIPVGTWWKRRLAAVFRFPGVM